MSEYVSDVVVFNRVLNSNEVAMIEQYLDAQNAKRDLLLNISCWCFYAALVLLLASVLFHLLARNYSPR
jgi:heme/copper-type cytochrome/quinol oxidase subunit 1